MFDAVDLLIVFMSFSRNKKNVVRMCEFDGAADCGGTVHDGFMFCAAREPGFRFGDDCFRRFRAGIVAGKDGEVGESAADLRHARTLGPVAVAAAAEKRDEASSAERPQGGQNPFQSIVGVSVVDECRGSVWELDAFEASGNLDGCFKRVQNRRLRDSERQRRRRCRG